MIELVDRAEILPVRHRVLRPGQPVEAAMYPEDANPEIFHLAARGASGAIIGCVTFFPEALPAGFPQAGPAGFPQAGPAGRAADVNAGSALAGRQPGESEVGDSRPSAWRFRGMATVPEQRNRGIGGELLEAGIAEAQRRGGRRVWCNGRSAARAFYLRHGFITVGAEFTLPPANHPHYLFLRALD